MSEKINYWTPIEEQFLIDNHNKFNINELKQHLRFFVLPFDAAHVITSCFFAVNICHTSKIAIMIIGEALMNKSPAESPQGFING